MKVYWEVDDGYCGGSRPQCTKVPDDELADCETEEEKNELIDQYIQEDFENRISWYIKRKCV